MNPNNELDRHRLIKAIANSTILPSHPTAGQGKWGGYIPPAYPITTRSALLGLPHIHVPTFVIHLPLG